MDPRWLAYDLRMGDGAWSGPFSFDDVRELWREGKVDAHTAYSAPGARARGTLSQFVAQLGPSPGKPQLQRRTAWSRPALNAAACAFCFALIFLHPYVEGRLNQDLLTIFFIVPVVLVPFFGALYFGLRVLVFGLPRACGHGRHLAALWVAFVMAVVLFLPAWQLIGRAHNSLFLYGFRHRITSQITPEQLRAVALKLQQFREASSPTIVGERFGLTSPGRRLLSMTPREDEARWEQMLVLPGFASLDDFCFIRCEPEQVDIWWGSALSFRRGVSVQLEGKASTPDHKASLPIASDIFAWIKP